MGISSTVKKNAKAAKEIAKSHLNGDAIQNEPYIVGGDSMDGIDPVDVDDIEEYKEIQLVNSRRPFLRTILMLAESIIVWFIITAPSWILSFCIHHERYNIVHFKLGYPGFTPNPYQEFWRWSVFFATSYVAFIFAAWIVGMASSFILGFGRLFKFSISAEVKHSLKLVKRTQYYIANLVWFVLMLGLGSLLLYAPALLNVGENIKMNEFLDRQKTERFLLAASFITALFAAEKYLIQVITYAFHRESLSARIAENNTKREAIGKLYRATRSGLRSAGSFNLHDEFADAGLHQIQYDKMLKDMESDAIANHLFKEMKPDGRDYLKPEDLKPYTQNEEEAKRIFKMLDVQLRGQIDQSYLRATFKAIYEERTILTEAIIENGRVIRRFDNVLMTIVAVLSIIGALSLFHAKGYTLVVSLFSILLTLAFLIKDTVTRLSDAFRLIYIERAFDVGDVVKVDGTAYSVTQVRLFTTTFLRNSDKVVVYIPNHILAGKLIVNTKRLPLTVDKATIVVHGNIPMAKVGTFKGDLKGFIEENFPEFSGNCDLKIKELGGDRVDMSVDLSFQPTSDEKVLIRRGKFKEKVLELLQKLEISASEPTF